MWLGVLARLVSKVRFFPTVFSRAVYSGFRVKRAKTVSTPVICPVFLGSGSEVTTALRKWKHPTIQYLAGFW